MTGTAPIPIRAGITPELDVERELIDYCAAKVREYCSNNGKPPTSIAIVLLGEDHAKGVSIAHSWTPKDEQRSRLQACSTASALLMRRAIVE